MQERDEALAQLEALTGERAVDAAAVALSQVIFKETEWDKLWDSTKYTSRTMAKAALAAARDAAKGEA